MRKIFLGIFCSFFIAINVAATAEITYGPTKANDTLWSIATKLRPNQDVSVQQVMLAIFCYNENAFYNNNVNALEPGKILTLPNVAYIYNIAKKPAYLEVVKQNRQWTKAKLKHATKRKKIAKIPRYKKTQNISSKPAKQQLTIVVPPTEKQSSEVAQVAVEAVVATANAKPDVTLTIEETPFAAEVNKRLTEIEVRSNIMQSQVSQLNEQLHLLEQSLDQLKQYNLESHWDFANKLIIVVQQIQQYFDKSIGNLSLRTVVKILVLCIVVVLCLGVIYSISRRRKNSVVGSGKLSGAKSESEDYDFMEGKDGIVAKLNLARAYIDMGKEDEAQVMLHEALTNGSPEEQVEAKELLAKIKKS